MRLTTLERWWPVTYDFGLIKSDIDAVAETRARMYQDAGLDVEVTLVNGPLEECLSLLEPLSPAPTKEVFFSTDFGWTVFFQNGARGSDPFLPMFQLSKALGVTAIRICATPSDALYPAVILAVYDTQDAGGDANGYRRSIAAANDGGRWVFEQSGTPYAFEDTSRYLAPVKRDRFTREMLFNYLAALGIPEITDESLQPDGQCRGIMLARPPHDHLPEYTLEEAKAL